MKIKQLVTSKEAAHMLGFSEKTLRNWRTNGRQAIPFIRIGRTVRYRTADLEAWLNGDSHFKAAGGDKND